MVDHTQRERLAQRAEQPKLPPGSWSIVKPRIPLAYAALLITALMAVVGFAAFSPGDTQAAENTATTLATAPAPDVSARVASAVLALRVTDAGSRVATTAAQTPDAGSDAAQDQTQTTDQTPTTAPPATTTTQPVVEVEDEPADDSAAEDASLLAVTAAPPTTSAPATTRPGDTTPPPIRVTSPHDQDTVTSRVVTFQGTSEPGAKVTSGPFAATMSDNGDWTIKLSLAEGANGASFTAIDKAGNSESTRIVVHYDPPTTTTKATTTTTKAATTTTKATPAATTTTAASSSSSTWSPNWPADAGGIRNVEAWRSTVEKYWPSSRVDCVLGIIYRESKGDPRAYNASSRAEGLMQHLSKYWTSRAKGAGFVDSSGKVASPYNGAANIAAGAYLGNYYDGAIGQWWNPWKSGSGGFTANYGSCTSSNPG